VVSEFTLGYRRQSLVMREMAEMEGGVSELISSTGRTLHYKSTQPACRI